MSCERSGPDTFCPHVVLNARLAADTAKSTSDLLAEWIASLVNGFSVSGLMVWLLHVRIPSALALALDALTEENHYQL